MSTQHLSEQENIRREKKTELENLGIDPYPAALYPVNTTAEFIKANYKGEENKADFADVCVAGRIMSVRDMGKANFAVMQDGTGKIQFYIKTLVYEVLEHPKDPTFKQCGKSNTTKNIISKFSFILFL